MRLFYFNGEAVSQDLSVLWQPRTAQEMARGANWPLGPTRDHVGATLTWRRWPNENLNLLILPVSRVTDTGVLPDWCIYQQHLTIRGCFMHWSKTQQNNPRVRHQDLTGYVPLPWVVCRCLGWSEPGVVCRCLGWPEPGLSEP